MLSKGSYQTPPCNIAKFILSFITGHLKISCHLFSYWELRFFNSPSLWKGEGSKAYVDMWNLPCSWIWKHFLTPDKAIQIQATVLSKLVKRIEKNTPREMLMTCSKPKHLCCKDSDKLRAVRSHLEYQNFIPLLYLFLAFIIIHWVP